MKSVYSKNKRILGPEKSLEARLGKIMKLNYKRIHEDFGIIIFKWGDGVQS